MSGSGGWCSTSLLCWAPAARAVVVKAAPAAATPSTYPIHSLVPPPEQHREDSTRAGLLGGCLQAGTPALVQIWVLACEMWTFDVYWIVTGGRQEMCMNVSLTLQLVALKEVLSDTHWLRVCSGAFFEQMFWRLALPSAVALYLPSLGWFSPLSLIRWAAGLDVNDYRLQLCLWKEDLWVITGEQSC